MTETPRRGWKPQGISAWPKRPAITQWIRLCTSLVGPMVCSCLAFAQQAEPAPAPSPLRSITAQEMFIFFFLMLGPLKILGPFVQVSRKADPQLARKIAVRAFFYSCCALVAAAFIGERSIRKYHVSIEVLAVAAGIILFLVALNTVMQQFEPTLPATQGDGEPTLRAAVSPLAFPTIVTPYGVAAVIICMALTPDILTKSEIFAALLGLMLLNLVAMLYARPILKYAAMPLQLVGTVLGVIQVALGLQIIIVGLRGLGVIARR